MSYRALARQWRPNTFSELVGQQPIVQALTHAISNQRVHHAYLFTGTRGVGKTTIARILAKCLNCEQGMSVTPCGTCPTCVDISTGCYPDLLEVDAASRTKVEDTRDLLDNVNYMPSRGRYKIYLIDEVHMLSNHSFNALLKTLEEPPAHVVFLFATTDPQKLPITILSRCLQFHLRRISVTDIVQKLKSILDAENVQYEETALTELAYLADGSLRDALSLTEQAIAYGNNTLLHKHVLDMLGAPLKDTVIALMQAIVDVQSKAVFEIVQSLNTNGVSWSAVLQDLLALLHQLALSIEVNEFYDHRYTSDAYQHLAKSLKSDLVQYYYQMVLNGRKDLPYCVDEKSGVEMILMRMLAFRNKPQMPQNGQNRQNGPRAQQAPIAPNMQNRAPNQPSMMQRRDMNNNPSPSDARATRYAGNEFEDRAATRAPVMRSQAQSTNALDENAPNTQRPMAPTRDGSLSVSSSGSPSGSSSTDDLQDKWHQLLTQLSLKGISKVVAEHCVVQKWTPEAIELSLDEVQSPLLSDDRRKVIAEAVVRTLGPINLSIKVVTAHTQDNYAVKKHKEREAAQVVAVNSIESDENIKTLISELGAVVENITSK